MSKPTAKPSRRKVAHVEFVKPVLLARGDAMPVRSLSDGMPVHGQLMGTPGLCPLMELDGEFIVVGKRRFSVRGPVVESFDLADE